MLTSHMFKSSEILFFDEICDDYRPLFLRRVRRIIDSQQGIFFSRINKAMVFEVRLNVQLNR